MELRRIQITGGSSYMVTLPKDWADSVGLKKNDTVSLVPQADGSLTLFPGGKESSEKRSRKIIPVDSTTDTDFLYRQLVGAYIAGHDTIEITSEDNIMGNIANVVSTFTQTSIGIETIDETENSIIIKDVMDPGEIKPSKSVDRMKVLTRNMLNDILTASETGNTETLSSMHDRDREVDRIHWLISRQVNMHQKDITMSSKMEMNLCDITRCNLVSRHIERIGDHAVFLAKNLRCILSESNVTIDKELISVGREIISLFVNSVETWNKKDMQEANACIIKANSLINGPIKLYRSPNERHNSATEMILTSMRRIAEYSIDISEIAINSAMDS